jgi:rod shape-determining protein MreC
MAEARKRHYLPLLFIALLAGQMLLMSAQAQHPQSGQSVLRAWSVAVAAPVLSSLHNGMSALGRGWDSYVALRGVSQENKTLRQEVDELKQQVAQLQEDAREAQRLRGMLSLGERLPVKSVAAQVIGRDVSIWFQSVMINRGRRDGVESGAAVITPGGLVGRIIEVGPLSSRVQLITDERSGTGAAIGVLGESRGVGVVVGSNEALCKMRYVPGSEPVREGETVFTTGQDRIYPRGIPVGRVLSVQRGSAMVSHDITIEPAARLNRLEEVLVLLGRPDDVRVAESTAPRP